MQAVSENEIFEIICLYWACISKTIKICRNQHADNIRFLLNKEFIINFNNFETIFQGILFLNVLIKTFFSKTGQILLQTVYYLSYPVKYYLCFVLKYLMT